MKRTIEKFIKCDGFNVAVVGKGKDKIVYFLEGWQQHYYPEKIFDSVELPLEAGVDADYIDEWLLKMDMKSFRKIARGLK